MDPIVVLVSAVVISILVIIVYNQLVYLVNQTKNAWADIDVLLKRRHDLIPNLVDVVKGYAKHEDTVFEKVTALRTRALTATTVTEKGQTESAISTSLKSIFAVAENYPELKASDNFTQLSNSLTQTEDDLASARRFYNANVRDLNTKIEIFPYNIFVKIFGFKGADFFQANEDEKSDVNINV